MSRKHFKRTVAGVLALVICMSSVGLTAFADEDDDATTDEAIAETDDDAADNEESSGRSRSKREEAVEEIEITAAQVEKYMDKMNTVDGVTFYARPDDYKDIEDSDVVSLLKKIEIAGIDNETGEVLCTVEKEDKGSDFISYLSDKGRFLVLTDKDSTKVTAVREIVSTLDNEYLFLSRDGKTLELYNDDYDDIVRTYTTDGKSVDGCVTYTNDDGWQVVLKDTLDEVVSSARFVTENDNLALYVDDDTAVIGLYDKRTGKMWWSTPESVGHDSIASNTIIDDLFSSLKLVYGEPEARSTTTQRSKTDGTLKIKDSSDGVIITYSFRKPGIDIPVTYSLGEDYLEVRVETSDIVEESDAKITTSLTLMGNFGAASTEEEGYFVIPDGSGALIRYNNGKTTAKSYTGYIYGSDVTAVPTTEPAVTQQVYFPMYGIVNSDSAMLVVCTQGDSNAKILASVSEQSNSSYNTCGFEFTLRDSDTYYMSGDTSTALTMFETGDIKTDTIAIRYYPLEVDDDPDYTDIANAYRDYLFEEGGVTDNTVDDDPYLSLSLYGGVKKERSILGVPIEMKTSLTSYAQAEDILSSLKDDGVDDISVQYYNWTGDGISGKIDTSAKPASCLGGKSDWNDLNDYAKQNGITIYPAVDNETFASGNGYHSFTSTAVRISGSYARVYDYNLAYGTQSTENDALSLLSPSLFGEVYTKLADNYTDKGIEGVSIGSMTSALYGDYGKKDMSRDDTQAALEESYATLTDSGLVMLADTANAYALPYVSEITNVPLTSSQFDIFDEDIPFYQMVLHGVIPYASTAVNAAATPNTAILQAVASGSSLHYDMIGEESSTLKDTRLESLYYASADTWLDAAAGAYQFSADVLTGVGDAYIVDYVVDGDVIETTYDDGTVITVDLDAETATRDGVTYVLADYLAERE